MKTIEQILALSKNPHYVLNEEEKKALNDYLKKQSHKNKNIVDIHSTKVAKHKTD